MTSASPPLLGWALDRGRAGCAQVWAPSNGKVRRCLSLRGADPRSSSPGREGLGPGACSLLQVPVLPQTRGGVGWDPHWEKEGWVTHGPRRPTHQVQRLRCLPPLALLDGLPLWTYVSESVVTTYSNLIMFNF